MTNAYRGSVDFGLNINTGNRFATLVQDINKNVSAIQEKLDGLHRSASSGNGFGALGTSAEAANKQLKATEELLVSINAKVQSLGGIKNLVGAASAFAGASPTFGVPGRGPVFENRSGWQSQAGVRIGPNTPWALQEFAALNAQGKQAFRGITKAISADSVNRYIAIASNLQERLQTLSSSVSGGAGLSPRDHDFLVAQLPKLLGDLRNIQTIGARRAGMFSAPPVAGSAGGGFKFSREEDDHYFMGRGAVTSGTRWQNPLSYQGLLGRIRESRGQLGGVASGEVSAESLRNYLKSVGSDFERVRGNLSPQQVDKLEREFLEYNQRIDSALGGSAAPKARDLFMGRGATTPGQRWQNPLSYSALLGRVRDVRGDFGLMKTGDTTGDILRNNLAGVGEDIDRVKESLSPQQRAKLEKELRRAYAGISATERGMKPIIIPQNKDLADAYKKVDRLFGSVTRLSGAIIGVQALSGAFHMMTQRVQEMDSAIARVRATVSRVASGDQKTSLVNNIVGNSMKDALSYGMDFTTASQVHTAAMLGARGPMASRSALGSTVSALTFTTPTMAQDYLGMISPLTNAGYTAGDINQFFKAASVMQAKSQLTPERVRAYMASYAANAPGLGMVADKETIEALSWHEAAATRDMVMGSKLNRLQMGLTNPRNLARLRDILSRGGSRDSIGGQGLDQMLNNGNPMLTLDSISQAYKSGHINDNELRAVAQTVDMWSSAPTMNLFKTGLDEWRGKVRDANEIARAGLLNPTDAARDQAGSMEASFSRITQSMTVMVSGGMEPMSKGLKMVADIAQTLAGNEGFGYLLNTVKVLGAAMVAWAAGIGVSKAVTWIQSGVGMLGGFANKAGMWGMGVGAALGVGAWAYDYYQQKQEDRVALDREAAAKNLPFLQRRLDSAGGAASVLQQVESLQGSGQLNEERRLAITDQLAEITNSRLEAERMIQAVLAGQTDEVRKQLAERRGEQKGQQGWLSAGMLAQFGEFSDLGGRTMGRSLETLQNSKDADDQKLYKMVIASKEAESGLDSLTGLGSDKLRAMWAESKREIAELQKHDSPGYVDRSEANVRLLISQRFREKIAEDPDLKSAFLDRGIAFEEKSSKVYDSMQTMDARRAKAGYSNYAAQIGAALVGDTGDLTALRSLNVRRLLGAGMDDTLFHGAERTDVVGAFKNASKNASPELAKALQEYFKNLNNTVLQELIKEILNPDNDKLREMLAAETGFSNFQKVRGKNGDLQITTDDSARLLSSTQKLVLGLGDKQDQHANLFGKKGFGKTGTLVNEALGLQAAINGLPGRQPQAVRDGIPKPINWMSAAQRIIGTADRATGAGNIAGVFDAMRRFSGGDNGDGSEGYDLQTRYKMSLESLNRAYTAEMAQTTDPNMRANQRDQYQASLDALRQQYEHLTVASSPAERMKRLRTVVANSFKVGAVVDTRRDVWKTDKNGNRIQTGTVGGMEKVGLSDDEMSLQAADIFADRLNSTDDSGMFGLLTRLQRQETLRLQINDRKERLSTINKRIAAQYGRGAEADEYLASLNSQTQKELNSNLAEQRRGSLSIRNEVLGLYGQAADANLTAVEFGGSTKNLQGSEITMRNQQRETLAAQIQAQKEILALLELQPESLEQQLAATQKLAGLEKQRAEISEMVIRAEKARAEGEQFSRGLTSTIFDFSGGNTAGKNAKLLGAFESLGYKGMAETANRALDSLGDNPLAKLGSFIFDPEGTLSAQQAQGKLTDATKELTGVMRELVGKMQARAAAANDLAGNLVTLPGGVSPDGATTGKQVVMTAAGPAIVTGAAGAAGLVASLGVSPTATAVENATQGGEGGGTNETIAPANQTAEQEKKDVATQKLRIENLEKARKSPFGFLQNGSGFNSEAFFSGYGKGGAGSGVGVDPTTGKLSTAGKFGVGAMAAMGAVQGYSAWTSNRDNGRAAQNYSGIGALAGAGSGIAFALGSNPVGWAMLAVGAVASILASKSAMDHQNEQKNKEYERKEADFRRLVAIQEEQRKSLGLAAERILAMRGDVGNSFQGVAASAFLSGRWAGSASSIQVQNLTVVANNPAELSTALTSAVTTQLRRGII